ncbi:adenylate/guanylate cyclase domain-containing protein [Tsukamurella spumae]|uniref:Adenylate/guanylate cyclase domain-containing protein n=1 Tax=Tsukamurella spumae TaxID=44753 RepID=A0A846X2X8_9ACTN|nr:adenylate/guanylate cyclase domain-containing protein [Tsukamurella spumae]NKY18875.1 adenylate/guanylate cyclase domain-containing protein [Tsukamurella spumae]
MSLLDDIDTQIDKTINTSMSITTRSQNSEDQSVPKPEDLAYNGGKIIRATYLYTDMHDSSKLAADASQESAARVFRGYLNVSTKVIRSHGGHIRSFDGDRVMGVFTGADQQDRAVKSAMMIKWAVANKLTPAIHASIPELQDAGWTLRQSSGIAVGDTLLARAGFRDNNDMISIGAAPNLAAKLSDIRNTGDDAKFETLIGKGAYSGLSDSCKISDGKNMWQGTYSINLGGKSYSYYRTSYHWKVS